MCLIGPSGCGKSTVLNMFAGLVTPSDGQILHDGRVISDVNTRVGYVTQDDNLLPWRSAVANVELALECKGVPRAERRERAMEYLARVGLKGREELYPHELSGGMRKRVSIVRTLVDESVDVILMDEPFGPLDAQTRLILQDELLDCGRAPAARSFSLRTILSKRLRSAIGSRFSPAFPARSRTSEPLTCRGLATFFIFTKHRASPISMMVSGTTCGKRS